MRGVISLEFLCQLHSVVRAVANQWMHEWTRTVLEFTQLRQMQEFSAITEDFTLTLARGVGRGRCHWSMCNWDECGGADVWNFSAGKFLQEIVRFNLGPSSFNCDAIYALVNWWYVSGFIIYYFLICNQIILWKIGNVYLTYNFSESSFSVTFAIM